MPRTHMQALGILAAEPLKMTLPILKLKYGINPLYFHNLFINIIYLSLILPGLLEEDEPAEGDEGELEVADAGDHPPHRHRQDAHGRPERPAPR